MSRERGAYERMLDAYPERVNRAGYWADLDGFEVHVIQLGTDIYGWIFYRGRSGSSQRPRFIAGGSCSSAATAWRAGCSRLEDRLRDLTGARPR